MALVPPGWVQVDPRLGKSAHSVLMPAAHRCDAFGGSTALAEDIIGRKLPMVSRPVDVISLPSNALQCPPQLCQIHSGMEIRSHELLAGMSQQCMT